MSCFLFLSVAQAKTGTGKTLAFLTPVVQRIINQLSSENDTWAHRRARSDDIRAIVISPTRELAEQIAAEARRLCYGTGIKVQVAVGGTQKREMLRRTRQEGCHLLVATPGRLADLLSDPESRIAAPRLGALVLDEADRMLEVGFKAELEQITDLLPDRREVPRQTLLYSATIPKNVVSIARQYIDPHNFEFVQTVSADEVPTHEKVPQYIVPCRGFENLLPSLLDLIRGALEKQDKEHPFKAIVFLPTTANVQLYNFLFQRLRYHDRKIPRVYDMHSRLTQAMRTKNSDAFREAKSAILFASDVAARGMDFPNVTHVFQVHLPTQRETYIHRIGRTGRAGKEGEAYLLVSNAEINAARKRLPGLPIKRFDEVESAKIDLTTADESSVTQSVADIRSACKMVPYELYKDTYQSMFGASFGDVNTQDVIDATNDLTKYLWGMDQPPAVSSKLLRNLPRGIRGLRVLDQAPSRTGFDRHGGSSFGGRGQREPKFRDEFEKIEYLAGKQGGEVKKRRVEATF
jgi:ATP-dependent RNA helicase MSS116